MAVSITDLLNENLYEVRKQILCRLKPSEISLLTILLQVKLTDREKRKYLNIVRELPNDIQDGLEHMKDSILIGKDLNLIANKIQNPIKCWSYMCTNPIHIWVLTLPIKILDCPRGVWEYYTSKDNKAIKLMQYNFGSTDNYSIEFHYHVQFNPTERFVPYWPMISAILENRDTKDTPLLTYVDIPNSSMSVSKLYLYRSATHPDTLLLAHIRDNVRLLLRCKS